MGICGASRRDWRGALEMELSGVETAEGMIPVSGGMRVGFTPKEGEAALPEVHAGDEVSVLALAKLPLVFRDAGAFDRRDNLLQRNIHLLANVRAWSYMRRHVISAELIGSGQASVWCM